MVDTNSWRVNSCIFIIETHLFDLLFCFHQIRKLSPCFVGFIPQAFKLYSDICRRMIDASWDVLSIRTDCGININSGNNVILTNWMSNWNSRKADLRYLRFSQLTKDLCILFVSTLAYFGWYLQTTLKGLTYNGWALATGYVVLPQSYLLDNPWEYDNTIANSMGSGIKKIHPKD